MFNPIGPHSQSVYWRRRLVVLGAAVLALLLVFMLINSMRSDGASRPTSQGQSSQPAGSTTEAKTPAPVSSSRATHSTHAMRASTPAKKAKVKKTAGKKKKGAASSSVSRHPAAAAVVPCDIKHLELRAMTGQTSYQVGDSPLLQLQVTNPGSAPCLQNLSDQSVQMLVYNGESRVWGSHDCKVAPGTDVRTLEPHVPVVVSLTWTGLSSQPNCAGTRQRANAGTYTLYAALGGRTGNATQFSIS